MFSQGNPDNHPITARIYGYNLDEIEAIPLAQARGLPTASTYDAFNSKIYSSWYNVYPVGDRAGVSIFDADNIGLYSNVNTSLDNKSGTFFNQAIDYVDNVLYLSNYDGFSIIPISINDDKTIPPTPIAGGNINTYPTGVTIHEEKGILFCAVRNDNRGSLGTFIQMYDIRNNNSFIGQYKTSRGADLLLNDNRYLYSISISTFNIYSLYDNSLIYSKNIPNGSYDPEGTHSPAGVINKISRTIHLLNCNGIHGEVITLEITDQISPGYTPPR